MSKSEKKMGIPSPAQARHPHPDREKATPKKVERKKEKRWGFSYEYSGFWRKPPQWKVEEKWFETERARDQALVAFKRKILDWEWYRNPKKVEK